MSKCHQIEGGYEIRGGGVPLRTLSEVVVLVDLKRGLALWSGAREVVEPRFDSLRNRCKSMNILDQFKSDIRLLSLPGDVSIDEMNWMMKKHLLPRRVAMRLRNANKEDS
jgi:hypothetical protein